MKEIINRFLQQQTCATICCIDGSGNPYCFNCFYAFDPTDFLLYFKSSQNAYHSILLANNPIIAGTVLPDKLSRLAIKGIQLTGLVLDQQHALAKNAFEYYHKKHPIAIAISGQVFTVQVNEMKMKDSNMGMGTKFMWNRNTYNDV